MDWRTKAVVQGILSVLPASERTNSLLQRATGSYAISPTKVPPATGYARRHLQNVDAFANKARHNCRFFEFGAGWGLPGPIAMALLGAGPQTVYDLHRHVRPAFVQRMLQEFSAVPIVDAVRSPPSIEEVWDALADLRIDYRAPADARATGLPDATIDVVTSTNTLEHIPPRDISRILDEMRRILVSDGLLSLQIDYKDHYSYADRGLSPFNFLGLESRRWRLVNNKLQYQNRLRHIEYVHLLQVHGFEVLDEDVVEPTDADLDVLASMSIASRFEALPLHELGRREAVLVARPRC